MAAVTAAMVVVLETAMEMAEFFGLEAIAAELAEIGVIGVEAVAEEGVEDVIVETATGFINEAIEGVVDTMVEASADIAEVGEGTISMSTDAVVSEIADAPLTLFEEAGEDMIENLAEVQEYFLEDEAETAESCALGGFAQAKTGSGSGELSTRYRNAIMLITMVLLLAGGMALVYIFFMRKK